MKYFKVVDFLSESSIDTNQVNYSLTLNNWKIYSPFLDFITTSSNELDLPLDFYFSINNNLALHGELYLQNFPKSKNGIFVVSDITSNIHHQGYQVSETQLVKIIQRLVSLEMDFFMEGFYLWELILEKVRLNKFKDLPSCLKSFFLFENIEDCNHFKIIKGGGQICNVELISTAKIFKGDMNIIDLVPNHYTYKKAEKAFEDYWNSKSSDNPVYEILFQGQCKLFAN